jgi:hypothetical protein
MRNHQQQNLNAPNAQWCASGSSFRTGAVAAVAKAMCKVRTTQIDPAAPGGPVKGGNP